MLFDKILSVFTFVHLRYFLGGDRPSQTTSYKLSYSKFSKTIKLEWYFTIAFNCFHLFYTNIIVLQFIIIVKVHGVFPSIDIKSASSRIFQFHQIYVGDSEEVVTPFMQVGTYPTRNFATFGPSELQPPFTGD